MKDTMHSSTPVELEFPVPSFDFRECDPAGWNGGSLPKSHFWNTMSSLLPNIEFCAIRSLVPLAPSITDEKLRREVGQFCAQEAAHGTAHSHYNSERLHGRYPKLAAIEAWERAMFTFFARRLPRSLFLALFVAVEHWTAAFSQYGLEEPDGWFDGCDATMFRLWEWHAVEELAHKAVCYDVFRYLGGRYLSLVAGMALLLCAVMLPGIALRMTYLFWKDGVLFKPRAHLGLLAYLLGRRGVLTKTARDFIHYFNPRYRPWDVDSMPLIRAWQARAPL
ncbi:MAG: metal-dependent hydrolase [Telluria sp.]